MTLLTGQQRREWSDFYANSRRFPPFTELTFSYTPRSYTLLAADMSLSNLVWQPTGSVDDVANQESISPKSSGASQHSGQPNFQTYETSSSLPPTFNINHPDIFLNSHGLFRDPLSDESRASSYSGDSNSDHSCSTTHSMCTVAHQAHNRLGALRNVGILDQDLQAEGGTLDDLFLFLRRSTHKPLS